MNKYKASFLVTAEALVEVEVSAENQQDGLVAAHDAIRLARPEQAAVMRLNVDTATNTAFERIESPAEPVSSTLSPLQRETGFTVSFFAKNRCTGEVAKQCDGLAYDSAKTLAESVLPATSAYGSACVTDSMGVKVVEAQSSRGGWEVELTCKPGHESENTIFSWLEDNKAAKATALQLLGRKEAAYVRILDYNNRAKGPVLWKEIR